MILKRLGLGVLFAVLLIIVVVIVRFRMDANVDYEVSTAGVEIPQFTTVEIPWAQEHDNATTLPFMASAVIDGDGIEELYLGGGRSQADVLFAFEDGQFRQIDSAGVTKADGEATHGASALDVDKDGDVDLFVTRSDGLWLHLNQGGVFSTTKLDATMPEGTTPLGIAVADINRDGHFDMFIGGYIRKDIVEGQNIFNRENYGGASQLFVNNGDNTFTNTTEASGLTLIQNTFMGIFVDADEDRFEDLIVAHDTGRIRTWHNDGGGTFFNAPNPTSAVNSYPMGIAVGDYNNDDKGDFFFSNVGSTPPNFLIRGDTTDDQVTNWKWFTGVDFPDINDGLSD